MPASSSSQKPGYAMLVVASLLYASAGWLLSALAVVFAALQASVNLKLSGQPTAAIHAAVLTAPTPLPSLALKGKPRPAPLPLSLIPTIAVSPPLSHSPPSERASPPTDISPPASAEPTLPETPQRPGRPRRLASLVTLFTDREKHSSKKTDRSPPQSPRRSPPASPRSPSLSPSPSRSPSPPQSPTPSSKSASSKPKSKSKPACPSTLQHPRPLRMSSAPALLRAGSPLEESPLTPTRLPVPPAPKSPRAARKNHRPADAAPAPKPRTQPYAAPYFIAPPDRAGVEEPLARRRLKRGRTLPPPALKMAADGGRGRGKAAEV